MEEETMAVQLNDAPMKLNNKIALLVWTGFFLTALSLKAWMPAGIFFIVVCVQILQIAVPRFFEEEPHELPPPKTFIQKTPYKMYYGDELNFTETEITTVLNKRFPYFPPLSQLDKKKFLERIQLFIADKVFKIHCETAYKEMPILISAAAIQLTFGLRKFLLPNFTYIHVYPEEFLGLHPSIRVLEGNVSGHAINLSWKHFLEGYANTTDGKNVGLHELAHALYYQNFIIEENVDRNFRHSFDGFSNYGNKVFQQELQPGNDLYSQYALRNFQEFWAESIEIFFEKPWHLKEAYPDLYDLLVELLNQDPCISTPLPQRN
jgi:MtfA peptidase